MEVWDDEDLILPSGPLILHSDTSETSGSSTSASALFSDHRRDIDEDEELWDSGGDAILAKGPDCGVPKSIEEFDEEKATTIKGLPPSGPAMKTLNTRVNVGQDWEDLALPPSGTLALSAQDLRAKASFASQISDDLSDDNVGLHSRAFGLPFPSAYDARIGHNTTFSTRSAHSSAASMASHVEDVEEIRGIEADFDLPTSLERISLSPIMQRQSTYRSSTDHHSRNVSSASSGSQLSFAHRSDHRSRAVPSAKASANSPRARTHTLTTSSSATSFSDIDPADYDADFFDDLVLPPFLGGPGLMTPPDSVDIKGKGRLAKVDLQSILSAKLQSRIDNEAGLHQRRRHVEPLTETWEEGLVIEDGQDWVTKPRVVHSSSPTVARSHRSSRRLRTVESDSIASMLNRVSRSCSLSLNSVVSSTVTLNRSPSRLRLSPLNLNGRVARHQQPRPSTPLLPLSGSDQRRDGELRYDLKTPSNRMHLPLIETGGLLSTSSPSSNMVTPQRSLKYKKSTPHLQPTPSITPPIPSLARKRSLASLSDVNLATINLAQHRLPSNSSVPLRNHTPLTSFPGKSYALPTLASRARQQSFPATPLFAITGSPSTREFIQSPTIPPARPSTPTGPGAAIRLTLPTVSSRLQRRVLPSASDPSGRSSSSLGTCAPTLQAALPQVMRHPKRPRQYGDGTELDTFDDLSTNVETERKYTARPVVRRTSGQTVTIKDQTDVTRKLPPDKLRTPKPTEAHRWRKPEPKVKPQLIRNLNPNATNRVEGGMTWNPEALRWEGNEAALRIFDNVVASSFRPALISQFSLPTPPIHDLSSPALSTGRAGATAGLGGVRIVGDMIFDPVRMSWYSRAPEGDDELDFGDDEADVEMNDGVDTVRLKPKASFVNFEASLTASSLTSSSSVGGTSLPDEEHTFWLECIAAERRHADELRPWSARRDLAQPNRSFLWEIRKIVTES